MPQTPLNEIQLKFIRSEMQQGKPLRKVLQEQEYDVPQNKVNKQLVELFGQDEVRALRKTIQESPQLFEMQLGNVCKRFMKNPELTTEMLERACIVLQECSIDMQSHKDNIS